MATIFQSLRPPASESTPALAVFTALLAVVALLTPIWAAEPGRMAGLLLLGGAAAEITHGFRRKTLAAQRDAWVGGAYTLLLALLLLNAAGLVASALAIFVAVPFAVDAIRQLGVVLRQAARRKPFLQAAWAAVWNLAVMFGVLLVRRYAIDWVVALAAGLRLVGTTINLVTAPVHSERESDESVIADSGRAHNRKIRVMSRQPVASATLSLDSCCKRRPDGGTLERAFQAESK